MVSFLGVLSYIDLLSVVSIRFTRSPGRMRSAAVDVAQRRLRLRAGGDRGGGRDEPRGVRPRQVVPQRNPGVVVLRENERVVEAHVGHSRLPAFPVGNKNVYQLRPKALQNTHTYSNIN